MLKIKESLKHVQRRSKLKKWELTCFKALIISSIENKVQGQLPPAQY